MHNKKTLTFTDCSLVGIGLGILFSSMQGPYVQFVINILLYCKVTLGIGEYRNFKHSFDLRHGLCGKVFSGNLVEIVVELL